MIPRAGCIARRMQPWLCLNSSGSLGTESVDRIEVRRSTGGSNTRNHANNQAHGQSGGHRQGRRAQRKTGYRGAPETNDGKAGHQAEGAAGHGEQD